MLGEYESVSMGNLTREVNLLYVLNFLAMSWENLSENNIKYIGFCKKNYDNLGKDKTKILCSKLFCWNYG